MNKYFTVFSSNRVEVLLEELKNSLFAQFSHPFSRRLIVVPSPAMESFLKLQFAKQFGIAAGFEFHKIDQTIAAICNLFGEHIPALKDAISPTDLELSLLFESFIKKGLEKQRWKPLFEYLHSRANSEKRLIPLCEQLAALFNQYGKYGCKVLEDWEHENCKNWQGELWYDIKQAHPQLMFPYQKIDSIEKHLQENSSSLTNLQIHLFAISFLPSKVHHFLEMLSQFIPVHYYWLSPCQLFWSDIRSDRENKKLQKFWKIKGATDGQQIHLEEYLTNRNALLANFGRMGREMASQIDESDADIKNSCALPDGASRLQQYEELLTDDVQLIPSKFTILEAVQSDMALLRNPATSSPIDFPQDNSIQVHVAYTKKREIEILFNTLLHILTKNAEGSDPITPGDIIVMAPDIREYEPMIHCVFGDENSPLDFHLMDSDVTSKSSLIQGYLHLLSLAGSRWEADKLFGLLDFPAFQAKIGITGEDIQQIREWIQSSGVRWGLSTQHRKEILNREHLQKDLVDDSPVGTWENSLGRLLMGLAIETHGIDEKTKFSCYPVDRIEVSQTALLNKWIKLILSLQKDLQPLSDGTQYTLQKWSEYLEYLKSEYFWVNSHDKEELANEGILLKHIQAIGSATRLIGNETFSFQTIKQHLEKLLTQEPFAYRENHLHAVRFCSMLPMRALPAKVVVLLGMQEGVFPRQEIPISLNELIRNPKADYYPTQRDFDRYLFLEALLSARNHFILSYVGYSFEDNKPYAPSILIQEFLAYLDEAYTINGQDVSSQCAVNHPFNVFDASYFTKESTSPSYVKDHFHLALKHSQFPKKDFKSFIGSFAMQTQEECEVCIHIKDLTSFASNPIKTYFNKTLGIYLEKAEQKEIKNEESFAINHLDKYLLKKEAVKTPYDSIFHKASQKGTVPYGMFKALAIQNLTMEFDEIHSNLAQAGVDKQNLFSIHFTDLCETPSFKKGFWMVPSLQIPYKNKTIKIVGSLSDVSSEGLLVYGKKELKSLIKNWPSFLLLYFAIKKYGLKINPKIVFTQSEEPFVPFFEDPFLYLLDYLDVYFLGLKQMCPLIPEWAEHFVKEDSSHLSKKMGEMNDDFSKLYNDYAVWVFRNENIASDSAALHTQWNKISSNLFAELIENWK